MYLYIHKNPILIFVSRFSPYFRTKEKRSLLSGTHSHKLHPGRVVCRFDLSGTCNDQHCPWYTSHS